MVSSAVVAPRKPPTLKRTRPDRHIGEIGSIYDAPRRSVYGPNGPPASVDQSFFFHHQDPDFTKLLPRVDRSRYEWPDEPASESNSDGEDIPDSQESLSSMLSELSAVGPMQGGASLQASTASVPTPADRRTRSAKRSVQLRRETRRNEAPKPASESSSGVSAVSQEVVPTRIERPSTQPVPTIVITSPDSRRDNTITVHQDTTVPFSLERRADVVVKQPNTAENRIASELSFPSSSPIIIQCTDTQDTISSTQQSEVFSPPDAFVHFSPPSQDDAQDAVITSALPEVESNKAERKPSPHSPRRSLPSSSQSASFEPALGKRSRAATGLPDQVGLKRRKSTE